MDWERIKELFGRAIDIEPEARRSWLERQCGSDSALLHEVQELLESTDREEHFLDRNVWSELARDADDAGRQIGPYRLVERIAVGGMGEVWRARRADDEFEQTVALKLVKRGMDSEAVVRRFRRERQLLAELEHPGIAQLFDGGTAEDGRPYLVMEFVDGRPIDEHCRDVAIAERVDLLAAVCDAVQVAHDHGVVHRDLKPSNVLVTPDGAVKLLDFGIAKVLENDGPEHSLLTLTGERLLTPRYAAPEQIQGTDATSATDVYALGVMLYEILTGASPYDLDDSSNAREVERAICETETHRPSSRAANATIRRRCAGDLDVIVLRAMSKDPGRRYRTAGALGADLRRSLRGEPILARPDTVTYRLGKFIVRHRLLVASTLAVILALAAGMAIAIVQYFDAESRRNQADATLREAQHALHVSTLETVVASLEAGGTGGALRSIDPERRGWEWRHLNARANLAQGRVYEGRSLDHLSVDAAGRFLAISEKGAVVLLDAGDRSVVRRIPCAKRVDDVELSPDGELLAWAHNRGGFVVKTEDGSEVAAWRHTSGTREVAFFHASPRLAAVHWDGTMFVFDLPAPEPPTPWKKFPPDHAVSVAIAPDDSMILTCGDDGGVTALSADSGQVLYRAPVAKVPLKVRDVAISTSGDMVAATSNNGIARVWRRADGQPLGLPRETGHYAYEIGFVPQSNTLLQLGLALRLTDLENGRTRFLTSGTSRNIRRFAVHPSEPRVFATTESKNAVYEWDLRDAQLPRHDLTESWVSDVSICPDGTEFVATISGATMAGEVRPGSTIRRIAAGARHVAHGPLGIVLAASYRDRVELRDATSKRRLATLRTRPVGRPIFTADGTHLIVATKGSIAAYRITDPSKSVAAWVAPVEGMAIEWIERLPGDEVLALSRDDLGRRIDCVDPTTRAVSPLFRLGRSAVRIAVSNDGRWLAVGNPAGGPASLQFRSLATGHVEASFDGEWVPAITFTPNGRRVLVATYSWISSFEVGTWKKLVDLPGGLRKITSLSMSADASVIVTGDRAGDVRVWRTRDE